MKVIIALLIVLIVQAGAPAYAQNKITLSLKNATLSRIFSEIRKQTSYDFLFDDSLLKMAKPVDIHVTGATLEDVLEICFKEQPLNYKIVGTAIVIKLKTLLPVEEKPRNRVTTQVRVRDEAGRPLGGATILVDGSTGSAFTDASGGCILENIDTNALLEITYTGYESQLIRVDSRTYIAVQLKVPELDSVIVSTGLQDIQKARSTGSEVKTSDPLVNRQLHTNVLHNLEGMVPGLVFNRSPNSPGLNSISIRSVSTLLSNQSPLIILDNFPYEGDINTINASEIESITVLKDAAAASIWGARAAGNGVIVVTTKKGKYKQQPILQYGSNFTITRKPAAASGFRPADFIAVEQFLFNQGFYDADLTNTNTWPVISPAVEIFNKRREGLITADDSTQQIDALIKTNLGNELSKHLYQAGLLQQHTLSLAGGSNNTHYRLAAGYNKNRGVITGEENDRVNVNVKVAYKPVHFIEVNAGVVLTTQKAKRIDLPGLLSPGSGGKNSPLPYTGLADDHGNGLPITKGYRGGFTDTVTGLPHSWKFNLLDEQGHNEDKTIAQDWLMNMALKFTVTHWMNVEMKYQYESTRGCHTIKHDKNSYYTRDRINYYYPPGAGRSAIPDGDIMDIRDSELQYHAFRGQLNLDTIINQHAITAIMGVELSHKHDAYNSRRYYGYNDNGLTFGNVDVINPVRTYWGTEEMIQDVKDLSDRAVRFTSYYANAAYAYQNTYLLSASVRRDGSNLFGVKTNNQWRPFYSIGAAVKISNWKFYNLSFLPYLKVRATLGTAGNVNNALSGRQTLQEGPVNELNNRPSYENSIPPNPDLKWEQTKIMNLGIDFASRGTRISGTVEYYHKRSTDLISIFTGNLTSGTSSFYANYATIQVNGIDAGLNARILDALFKWEAVVQGAYHAVKLLRYPYNPARDFTFAGTNGSIVSRSGIDPYSILSWRYGGLDATGDPLGYVNDAVTKNYQRIQDSTSFNELVNSGSARPKLTGSFRNTFTWKNWSLSALITWRFLYVFRRNNYINYSALFNNWDQGGYYDFVRRYQHPGDELITTVPAMTSENPQRENFYKSSEATVEKGGNIRLHDVRLDYGLDKSVWKKMPFQTIGFYLRVANAGILYKETKVDIDPDFGTAQAFNISVGIQAVL